MIGKQTQVRLLKPEQIFIDDIGIGRGVTDRLKEMSAEVNGVKLTYNVNGVTVGERAKDPTKYYNQKAENYWLAQEWLKKEDTKLLRDKENRWYQFVWIKYKVSTDKVLQIEPKPELKKRKESRLIFVKGQC